MYFSFDLRALVASEKEHSVAGHKAVTVWSLEKSSSERVRIALSCNQGQNLRLAGEEAVARAWGQRIRHLISTAGFQTGGSCTMVLPRGSLPLPEWPETQQHSQRRPLLCLLAGKQEEDNSRARSMKVPPFVIEALVLIDPRGSFRFQLPVEPEASTCQCFLETHAFTMC